MRRSCFWVTGWVRDWAPLGRRLSLMVDLMGDAFLAGCGFTTFGVITLGGLYRVATLLEAQKEEAYA